MLKCFATGQLQMSKRQGYHLAVKDEHRTHAGPQANIAHSASVIASQRLHAGVVNALHGDSEGLRDIERYRARSEVMRIFRWLTVDDFTWISYRNSVIRPLIQILLDSGEESVRGHLASGGKLYSVRLAGQPEFD